MFDILYVFFYEMICFLICCQRSEIRFSFVRVQVTAILTTNLNKIIDVTYYPAETAKKSNMRHRPIGIGVQGLADAFMLLGMPFDSPEVIDRSQEHPFDFCCLVVVSVWSFSFCAGSTAQQRHI